MNLITDLARELRKNQTPEEKILWGELRGRRLGGFKFLRQKPIICDNDLFFVADFYCAEMKLVVELDGKIHQTQKEYDAERDRIMTNMGIRVMRLENEELNNISEVRIKILNELNLPSPLSIYREGPGVSQNKSL
ncbi:MAG: restriction endonuclease [Bacteroidetes bacterium HGW-Bacteroidetes-21]|jgi:leucyl-tRNA synthetase|nr:MAG: restriction endonuclease [Bacteroidetes bacterium HGW-Bacteroidetes-21]